MALACGVLSIQSSNSTVPALGCLTEKTRKVGRVKRVERGLKVTVRGPNHRKTESMKRKSELS